MEYKFCRKYTGEVKAVIFDWAGTTVDYGCFAPAVVFVEVFKIRNIEITIEQARIPMGIAKRDHIKEILNMSDVAEKWQSVYGRSWNENDLDELYADFIPRQIGILSEYSELIPGVKETVDELRKAGIKIGSTTGYNTDMTAVVIAESKKQGFLPDSIVCANEVPAGRPAPWMALQNTANLGVYPLESIVKIGDTIPDIEEGLNASMWSIGVVTSSNEMGMTIEEVNAADPISLEKKKEKIRNKFLNSGAHYVIDSITELPVIIEDINYRLRNGEKP
jgi:phosphonoacetaldehyde hydrolase